MITQAFTTEFAQALEVNVEMINDNFNMERDAAWDSLAFISTIALIDKYYNIIIDGAILQTIKTFGELKALLPQGVH